jgi:hypothetical protein
MKSKGTVLRSPASPRQPAACVAVLFLAAIVMRLRMIHESLIQLQTAGHLPDSHLLQGWPEDERDTSSTSTYVRAVLAAFEQDEAWARAFEETQRVCGAAFLRTMDQVVGLAIEVLAHTIIEAAPSATEYLQAPPSAPLPTATICVGAITAGLRIASLPPHRCRMHLARCSGAAELAERALVLLASEASQDAQSHTNVLRIDMVSNHIERASVSAMRSSLELIFALSASSIVVCKELVRSSEPKTLLLLQTFCRVLALTHSRECLGLILRILDALLRFEPLRTDVLFTSPIFASEIGTLVGITLAYLASTVVELGRTEVAVDSKHGADGDVSICAAVVTQRLLKVGVFPMIIAAWITPATVAALSSVESAFRSLSRREAAQSAELCLHVIQLLAGLLETEGYGALVLAEVQRQQQQSKGTGAIVAETLRSLVAAPIAGILEPQRSLLQELARRVTFECNGHC